MRHLSAKLSFIGHVLPLVRLTRVPGTTQSISILLPKQPRLESLFSAQLLVNLRRNASRNNCRRHHCPSNSATCTDCAISPLNTQIDSSSNHHLAWISQPITRLFYKSQHLQRYSCRVISSLRTQEPRRDSKQNSMAYCQQIDSQGLTKSQYYYSHLRWRSMYSFSSDINHVRNYYYYQAQIALMAWLSISNSDDYIIMHHCCTMNIQQVPHLLY